MASDWDKTPNAPATGEMGGELSGRRASFGDIATPDHPTTGRLDEAAATFGMNEELVGGVAAGDPNENTGGAMGAMPGSAVADQPTAGGGIEPEERAGIMGSGDAQRLGTTTGGGTTGELGEGIDRTEDAAARTSAAGAGEDLGS